MYFDKKRKIISKYIILILLIIYRKLKIYFSLNTKFDHINIYSFIPSMYLCKKIHLFSVILYKREFHILFDIFYQNLNNK